MSNSEKKDVADKIDFDNFSNEYLVLMSSQHSKYGDIEYYSEHKAKITKKIFAEDIINILEFGCGIGRNLPAIQEQFPKAKIFASDISKKSLDIARSSNPGISILEPDSLLSYKKKFDLIFIAGVFHHIPPEERADAAKKIDELLSKNGKLICFEHNPCNPLTRHMVNTCAFDEDAVLLTKKELTNIFEENDLKIVRSGYTLFVPPKLKQFNMIETYIEWLPLGGQYYIAAEKK